MITSIKIINPTRILFIGNSFLYYGDGVHSHIRRMAIESGLITQQECQYKSVMISGAFLGEHSIDSYLKPMKLNVLEPFQVVILQENSAVGWDQDYLSTFRQTIREYVIKIRAIGAEPVLLMTPAYTKPHELTSPKMIKNLNQYYTEVGDDNRILIIPAGLAFEKAYKQNPNIRLHMEFDGRHPSRLGSLLMACTIYAGVYGSPINNSYNYYGRVDKQDKDFIQKIAQETIDEYYTKG